MKGFLYALQFLTRLPLPFSLSLKKRDERIAIATFPLVGLLLGGIYFGAFKALEYAGASRVLTVMLLLAIHIYSTGAMHLDGVADVADCFFSNREREKLFAILKDSHIGTFGVVAIVLSMFLYATGINESLQTPYVLLLAPVLARTAVLRVIVREPLAKQEGMGAYLHNTSSGVLCAIATLLVAIGVGYLTWRESQMYAVLFLISYIPGYILSRRSARLLGGVTGDVYGASVEMSELLVLLLGGIVA